MATRPQYKPEWAMQDVNLPATGQPNKERPKESLRLIGWDKGQIPTAEEFNWTLHNLWEWTQYYDESINENLDSFLPKQGTKITFNGKATGVAQFTGSQETEVTLSIFDLENATDAPTPNRIVKRNAQGAAAFRQDVIVRGAGGGSSADYLASYRFAEAGGNLRGSITWYGETGVIGFTLGTPGVNETTLIQMGQYYVSLWSPRSTQPQENRGDALTRKDYVDGLVNNVTDTAGTGWFKSGATGYLVQSFSGEGSTGGQVIRTATFPVPFTSRVDSIVISWKDTDGQPDYPPRILSNTNTTVTYVADGNGNVSFIATGV